MSVAEFEVVTEEDGKRDPTLLADPSEGNKGILDKENPADFVRRDEEAAEGIVLADDVEEES